MLYAVSSAHRVHKDTEREQTGDTHHVTLLLCMCHDDTSTKEEMVLQYVLHTTSCLLTCIMYSLSTAVLTLVHIMLAW